MFNGIFGIKFRCTFTTCVMCIFPNTNGSPKAFKLGGGDMDFLAMVFVKHSIKNSFTRWCSIMTIEWRGFGWIIGDLPPGISILNVVARAIIGSCSLTTIHLDGMLAWHQGTKDCIRILQTVACRLCLILDIATIHTVPECFSRWFLLYMNLRQDRIHTSSHL